MGFIFQRRVERILKSMKEANGAASKDREEERRTPAANGAEAEAGDLPEGQERPEPDSRACEAAAEDEKSGPLPLEKHDRLAIVIAALLVFLPVVLLFAVVMLGMIWLFASRFAG